MTAEADQGEGDQCVGGLEAERDPGDQPDLGVGRLDQAVGQVVLDRGEDAGPVFDDALLQLHERRDATAPRPADPPVEGLDGGGVGVLVRRGSMPRWIASPGSVVLLCTQ